MKKNVVKLSESQLRNIIRESISEFRNMDDYLDMRYGDDIRKIYGQQFKEVLSHLEMAMNIMNNIDETEYGNYSDDVGEKLAEMYDKIETCAIDVKSFINGEFVTSLFPRG